MKWFRDAAAAVVSVKVEIEVIDKLDEMISEGQGDDEYKQLFTTMYVLTLLHSLQLGVYKMVAAEWHGLPYHSAATIYVSLLVTKMHHRMR